MKLKLINKTQSVIWLDGYCFVPGETITQELSAQEQKKLEKMLKTDTIQKRTEEISYEWIKTVKEKETETSADEIGKLK